MISLPPVSSDTYQALFAHPVKADAPRDPEPDPTRSNDRSMNDPELSNDGEALLVPQQCIFCLDTSDTTAQNLDHMAATHGLVIPDVQELQTDVETLVSYLHLVVADYCECLFCGATKSSAQAARAHMVAKGHCMMNLSAGSEFLEFWESESSDTEKSDRYQLLSKTEMRLASGAIATSREDTQSNTQSRPRRAPRNMEPAKGIPTPSESSEEPKVDTMGGSIDHHDQPRSQRPSRTLAIRDQMGLTGLSDAQRQSLAVSQRKIDLSALRSRNKAQWTLEKMGNKVKQKHFVVGSPCRSGWFLDPVMR